MAKSSKPAHKPKITMSTIGKLVGVSQVTVSRALANPSKVAPDTLKRIQDAISATGFVPNAIAGALASSKSHLICAMVPSISNVTYSSMLQSFSDNLREKGYELMVSETGFTLEHEEQLVAAHLSRRPDGFLLTGITHSRATRKMLLGQGVPVVEVWDITGSPIDCCVGLSHFEAGRAVAEFAFKAGYRRAATVTATDDRAILRRDGFAARFAELSGKEVLQVNRPAGTSTLGWGRRALAQLIDKENFRKGLIFCSSDFFAHGLLVEARARGIKVPGQLAVMGFGDQEFAADTDPALTTVRIDRRELGRIAAKVLMARIHGESVTESVIKIGFKIIRRDSA